MRPGRSGRLVVWTQKNSSETKISRNIIMCSETSYITRMHCVGMGGSWGHRLIEYVPPVSCAESISRWNHYCLIINTKLLLLLLLLGFEGRGLLMIAKIE